MTRLESRIETLDVRGLRYNIRHWGAPGAPKFFLLHGWMDSSATFQFVVDALAQEWHVIAPDWRGYGASEWLNHPYWFPDYYADLDHIVRHYAADQAVRLVGHSMGANIASTYASIRPQQVSQLVMLDFLGLQSTQAADAPAQLARWLKHLENNPRLRTYDSHAALARRLQLVNPRLNTIRAEFLSRHVSHVRPDGLIEMACDPWHKAASPNRYQIEDTMAYWQAITAPVLMVIADDGFVEERFGNDPEEYQRRIACFAKLSIARVANAGHNLQHDQPEQVASILEHFLQRD